MPTQKEITALRAALRAKFGARHYRITRTGDVHVYGQNPSCTHRDFWWLMGDIDYALWRMGVQA